MGDFLGMIGLGGGGDTTSQPPKKQAAATKAEAPTKGSFTESAGQAESSFTDNFAKGFSGALRGIDVDTGEPEVSWGEALGTGVASGLQGLGESFLKDPTKFMTGTPSAPSAPSGGASGGGGNFSATQHIIGQGQQAAPLSYLSTFARR